MRLSRPGYWARFLLVERLRAARDIGAGVGAGSLSLGILNSVAAIPFASGSITRRARRAARDGAGAGVRIAVQRARCG